MSPDTIVPGADNPQAWNRYSYALNNPIRYNDPDGHCPVCAVALVDAVPFIAAAAVATLVVVAISPDARTAAAKGWRELGGTTGHVLTDFLNKVAATNRKRNDFNLEDCKKSKACKAFVVAFIGAVVIEMVAHGGIDKDESNVTYPTFDTLTPSLTPASTSTPSNTSTSTPSCPPYNNGCPTSTSTPSSTSTPPVSTPITPPVYTPAPPHSGGPAIPI